MSVGNYGYEILGADPSIGVGITPSDPSYIDRMRRLGAEKMQPGTEIINPWSSNITAAERAETHAMLLAATYGSGHPGSAQGVEGIMQRQQEGSLLTWIVKWNNMPVGMGNFEIQSNGVAEAVRSVALPRGTLLPSGDTFSNQANISAAMYQRVADILEHPNYGGRLMALEGDVRLASTIKLPNGDTLKSGVSTQHINKVCGLNPYLLVVPRYQVHPEGGAPHQEAFLQSRLYIDPQRVRVGETLHTPLSHPRGKTTIADIARTTFSNAHGINPEINDWQTEYAPGELILEPTADIHFSTVRASGDVETSELVGALMDGLEKSRFVEIVIPNRPENIELQRRLLRLPVMPLGVFPGGEFTDADGIIRSTETTIHYGITRPEIARQMVEVELARDYKGSQLETLVHRLRKEWREHAA